MPPDAAAVADALRNVFRRVPEARLYGVVDGARCIDLAYEAKVLFGKEISSLFLPQLATRLWDVAPYVVPIDADSDYLLNWARRWATNTGVLLVSSQPEAT